MRRGTAELSEYDRREAAEGLTLPADVLGVALLAALMCLALVWLPSASFDRAVRHSAPIATRGIIPLPKAARAPGSRPQAARKFASG